MGHELSSTLDLSTARNTAGPPVDASRLSVRDLGLITTAEGYRASAP